MNGQKLAQELALPAKSLTLVRITVVTDRRRLERERVIIHETQSLGAPHVRTMYTIQGAA
jgi:hypothetical protein